MIVNTAMQSTFGAAVDGLERSMPALRSFATAADQLLRAATAMDPPIPAVGGMVGFGGLGKRGMPLPPVTTDMFQDPARHPLDDAPVGRYARSPADPNTTDAIRAILAGAEVPVSAKEVCGLLAGGHDSAELGSHPNPKNIGWLLRGLLNRGEVVKEIRGRTPFYRIAPRVPPEASAGIGAGPADAGTLSDVA